MNGPRLQDYIEHMAQAVQDAISFTDGMDEDQFQHDRRTQQAVIMSLVILGEAATKVMDTYPEFVERHADISWHNMRGMRNRLAHGYFAIDLGLVWATVKSALPPLLSQLRTAQAVAGKT